MTRLLSSLARLIDTAVPADTGHVHAGSVGALSVCHDPDCPMAREAAEESDHRGVAFLGRRRSRSSVQRGTLQSRCDQTRTPAELGPRAYSARSSGLESRKSAEARLQASGTL